MAFTISSANTNPGLFSRKKNISVMENLCENLENARVYFRYYQSACNGGHGWVERSPCMGKVECSNLDCHRLKSLKQVVTAPLQTVW